MLWHGRPHSCGSWLPEDKKKLICGMEEQNVVAYDRLPSPTHLSISLVYISTSATALNLIRVIGKILID